MSHRYRAAPAKLSDAAATNVPCTGAAQPPSETLVSTGAENARHGTLTVPPMTPTDTRQGWHPLTSPSVWSPPLPVTGAPLAPPAALPATEDIRVGKDGRIHGVDGMLDQIAQALTRHAGPMLARDVLPIMQRDEALQARVGQAAGVAMADTLKPWVIAGASALAVLAVIEGYRFYTQRNRATRR